MLSYIGRRLLLLVPTLFGISLVSFFLIHLAPGDPATAILGVLATPEMLARFREQHHLDQAVPVQYLQWLGALLQGDLGFSVSTPVPVMSLLTRQLPPTVLLTLAAVAIAVPVGTLTGVLAATHRGRLVDTLSRATFLFGLSMPSFWLGLLLILFVGVSLRLLPVGGYVEPGVDPVATFRSLVLPALTLSVPMAAVISRITRTAVLEVMGSDFVRTAHAKGVPEAAVLRRHVLRNALIPTLTTIGLQVGYLLGGAVVVENVFNLPGLGRLLTTAVGSRDYGVIQGLVLLGATVVVVTQLVIDLIVVRLDPRITLR